MDTEELRYLNRARLLWPRLDPARLCRTGGDPRRIARLVAERTTLPIESIVALLTSDAGERTQR